MRPVLGLVAAGALICSPASAQAQAWAQTEESMPARLIEVGTWQFEATKLGPDGKPECYESWTFNADSTGLIISGQQHVTISWKADQFEDLGQFVFVTNEASTEGPDCMGRQVDLGRYPNKSPGFQLIFFENGNRALICNGGEILRQPDGTTSRLLDMKHCWGRIVPLVQD